MQKKITTTHEVWLIKVRNTCKVVESTLTQVNYARKPAFIREAVNFF